MYGIFIYSSLPENDISISVKVPSKPNKRLHRTPEGAAISPKTRFMRENLFSIPSFMKMDDQSLLPLVGQFFGLPYLRNEFVKHFAGNLPSMLPQFSGNFIRSTCLPLL